MIFILFICWVFYLANAIKYRKSSCENYVAEIKSFKSKTFEGKNNYTYRYIVDNIEYFGEIKTNKLYNVGDKIEIAYKRNNRSESITIENRSKLAGKILLYLIAWLVCNVIFVLSVWGQYLYYNG
ncbi:MAG: hypothetical protein IKE91_05385 [Clostridia bacterium]|nr:hypothetical protein [Clostridia bacterium]